MTTTRVAARRINSERETYVAYARLRLALEKMHEAHSVLRKIDLFLVLLEDYLFSHAVAHVNVGYSRGWGVTLIYL